MWILQKDLGLKRKTRENHKFFFEIFLFALPLSPSVSAYVVKLLLLGGGCGLYRECDTLGQHLTCWIRVWHCTIITAEQIEIAGIDQIQPRKEGTISRFPGVLSTQVQRKSVF